MNVGIVGSFVVGGIVLISLLNVQLGVQKTANQQTMNLSAKQQLETVVDLVEYDFPKIGYLVGPSAIQNAQANQITFQSDLYDQDTVLTVTWRFDTTQANIDTRNPNDFTLRRIISGQTSTINLNIVDFDLRYENSQGNTTVNTDSIRGIHVSIVCQSPEMINDRFYEAAWEKTFYPVNLRLALQ